MYVAHVRTYMCVLIALCNAVQQAVIMDFAVVLTSVKIKSVN